jgi:hypothetical protein
MSLTQLRQHFCNTNHCRESSEAPQFVQLQGAYVSAKAQATRFHHFNTPISTATITKDLLGRFSPGDKSDHSAMLDLPQS